MIGRRHFVALMGGAIIARPLAARSQQPATRVIGFLSNVSLGTVAHAVAAFRQGLKETGYIEGQNLAIGFFDESMKSILAPVMSAYGT
jgi:putative tryptophan/tyrosine transport system substrate-binding protein